MEKQLNSIENALNAKASSERTFESEDKKKVGAKPLPDNKKSNMSVTFYLTKDQFHELESEAENNLDSVGVFAKKTVLRYLRNIKRA